MNTADFSKLDKQDAALGKRLKDFIKETEEKGALEGAQRLILMGKFFERMTVEEAYHFIDQEDILKEVAEGWVRRSRIGIWQFFRNLLSLAPLLATWYGLFIASSAYQQYGTLHPKDQTPFLDLWQNSFGGIRVFGFHPVLTFAEIAITDVVLLSLLLICILMVQYLEARGQKIADGFAKKLGQITDALIELVNKAGTKSLLNDDDVTRIAEAVNRSVSKAMTQSDKVAQKAENFIDASEKRVNAVIQTFEDNLNLFNADLTQLTNSLGALSSDLQSHTQQVQDLTAASQVLANSSTTLAGDAHTMATSTAQNAQASLQIVQQLQSLDTTQQQMVQTLDSTQQQVIQELAQTQLQVVDAISINQQNAAQKIEGAAKTMKGVAQDTKAVAKELGDFTKADLQQITARVEQAAISVERLANGLGGIEQALVNAAAAISTAANSLNNGRISIPAPSGKGSSRQAPPLVQQAATWAPNSPPPLVPSPQQQQPQQTQRSPRAPQAQPAAPSPAPAAPQAVLQPATLAQTQSAGSNQPLPPQSPPTQPAARPPTGPQPIQYATPQNSPAQYSPTQYPQPIMPDPADQQAPDQRGGLLGGIRNLFGGRGRKGA